MRLEMSDIFSILKWHEYISNHAELWKFSFELVLFGVHGKLSHHDAVRHWFPNNQNQDRGTEMDQIKYFE